jgi:DNA-binding NarL/FixJ family response regulator
VSERIRLVLVDDHELVLESLRSSLSAEFDVLASVATGAEVLPAVLEHRPDVLLLDLGLPDRSGLEILSDLKQNTPDLRILVVTMHNDPVLVESALQSGATGFIPKNAGLQELCGAVREVAAGHRYVSPRLPRRADRPADGSEQLGFGNLTPRQRQIVRLLGEGKTTAEIAVALSLSPNTITYHRSRVRKALGLTSEVALDRYAFIILLSQHDRLTPSATETPVPPRVPVEDPGDEPDPEDLPPLLGGGEC